MHEHLFFYWLFQLLFALIQKDFCCSPDYDRMVECFLTASFRIHDRRLGGCGYIFLSSLIKGVQHI